MAILPDEIGSQHGHQPIVVNSIEELLQIEIDDPLVPVLQMHFGLGDRRVAAPSRSKSVATCVKRRFVMRTEHLVHSLLQDSIDHVRYAKTSCSTACFRDPYPSDEPRVVAAV